MIGPGGSRPDQGDEAHAKMTGTFWALRGKGVTGEGHVPSAKEGFGQVLWACLGQRDASPVAS